MIYVLSGGGGLNLKVVGGTTQPTSPKENTVWVNTDTEISGYAFSATEPENPAEGMVWFNVGASSNTPINALKKDILMVYPTACQQYINSAWVAKEAKTFQGGTWNDWTMYIYDYASGRSVEFVEKTFSYDSLATGKGYIYFGTTGILMRNSDGASGALSNWITSLCTLEKYDLSEYSKAYITFDFTTDAGNNDPRFFISSTNSGNIATDLTSYVALAQSGTYSIDISNLTDSYYLGAEVSNAQAITVKKIWLE